MRLIAFRESADLVQRTGRERGYTALQFNFVVASNEGAVRLWQKHGFAVVGRVPRAFRHRALGPVDVLIMHRAL